MKIFHGRHSRGLGAGFLMIRGFVGRLVSLFAITQQDLLDAGVFIDRMYD